MSVQDEARRRMEAFRDDLVSQGWTLVRDNEAGGALVIEHEGIRLVASIHGYEVKDLDVVPPTVEEAVDIAVTDLETQVVKEEA